MLAYISIGIALCSVTVCLVFGLTWVYLGLSVSAALRVLWRIVSRLGVSKTDGNRGCCGVAAGSRTTASAFAANLEGRLSTPKQSLVPPRGFRALLPMVCSLQPSIRIGERIRTPGGRKSLSGVQHRAPI
jgi:hypothetical protein